MPTPLGTLIVANCVTSFHRTVYLEGWFKSESSVLSRLRLVQCSRERQFSDVFATCPSVEDAQSFRLEALTETGFVDTNTVLFQMESGDEIEIALKDLVETREAMYQSKAAFGRFSQIVSQHAAPMILDIGGRNRSGKPIMPRFSTNAVHVVTDIVNGPDVDVVGDAHRLSSLFTTNSFDFAVSIDVFEHLLMPWKVVVELNRVLKPGGRVWVSSHQTIGLHDLPWDFWRFSRDSWSALFNSFTGFEIIEAVSDHETFVLPFLNRTGKHDSVKSAGHEISAVHAIKVSQPKVEWQADMESILQTTYPT